MSSFFEIEFLDSKPQKGRTKFGGQPNWLTTPEWPISKETGNPMRFICQVDLTEIGYAENSSKFAYLFMTDEDEYVDGTWEADGGENAIILQPGENQVKTQNLEKGPSLYKMVKKLFKKKLVPQDFECAVKLTEKKEIIDYESDELDIRNKFNGEPVFIQGDEYPSNDKWNLLIQLDATNVPFYVNFGDAGVGYGFINETKNKAKFIWQCM
ncbi:MAG: DUF1963 domain-containing protein [Cytophagia bacterium]|nr:DUF1963 domain-containing protein [Cytophagia bacterium]